MDEIIHISASLKNSRLILMPKISLSLICWNHTPQYRPVPREGYWVLRITPSETNDTHKGCFPWRELQIVVLMQSQSFAFRAVVNYLIKTGPHRHSQAAFQRRNFWMDVIVQCITRNEHTFIKVFLQGCVWLAYLSRSKRQWRCAKRWWTCAKRPWRCASGPYCLCNTIHLKIYSPCESLACETTEKHLAGAEAVRS